MLTAEVRNFVNCHTATIMPVLLVNGLASCLLDAMVGKAEIASECRKCAWYLG